MKLSDLVAPFEQELKLKQARRNYLKAFDAALERRDPAVMDAVVHGLAKDLWRLAKTEEP